MRNEVPPVIFGALPIIILPFLLLIIVLGFITLNRYIRYKERVALAQLGFSLEDMNRADTIKKRGDRGVLWGGVITAMSGLALLLGLATLGIGAWLLAGLLPLFVGLGMVLIYFATLGAEPSARRVHPASEQQATHADASQESNAPPTDRPASAADKPNNQAAGG
jgi:hypothetical protein